MALNQNLYAVVEWIEEDETYSVVPLSKLLSSSKQKEGHNLVDQILDWVWDSENEVSFPGKVLKIGSNEQMLQRECNALSSKAAEKSFSQKEYGKGLRLKTTKRVFSSDDETSNEEEIYYGQKVLIRPTQLEESKKQKILKAISLQEGIHAEKENKGFCERCKEMDNLKQELYQQNELLKRYKAKIKQLKEQVTFLKENNNEALTDIGSGVRVPTSVLQNLSVFSSSPQTYARSLLKIVFSEEMLKGSLNGKQCPANTGKHIFPQVDIAKTSDVIDYKCKSFDIQKQKGRKDVTSIKKSLTDLLHEMRSKKRKLE